MKCKLTNVDVTVDKDSISIRMTTDTLNELCPDIVSCVTNRRTQESYFAAMNVLVTLSIADWTMQEMRPINPEMMNGMESMIQKMSKQIHMAKRLLLHREVDDRFSNLNM